MSPEEMLATLALVENGGPCEHHASHTSHSTDQRDLPGGGLTASFLIDAIDTVSEMDARYMLLSLVLDLWRRNEYAYQVLRSVAATANSDIAATIAAHSAMISAIDLESAVDWKGRAIVTNGIVHRMLLETDPHHSNRLEEAARPVREGVRNREEALLAAMFPHGFPPPRPVADLTNRQPGTPHVPSQGIGTGPHTREAGDAPIIDIRAEIRQLTARLFNRTEDRVERGPFKFMVMYDSTMATRHAEGLNQKYRFLVPLTGADVNDEMTLDALTIFVKNRPVISNPG